jgi:hypothetical protein
MGLGMQESIMRKFAICFVTALSLIALPAYADRGGDWHGYGGYGHHHGGGAPWAGLAVVGALTGLAIMAERNRPVYVDSYPAAVYPAPARLGSENWYYCQSSAMYYPYTTACPEGWQAVPARR